jgi:hypothetical protein
MKIFKNVILIAGVGITLILIIISFRQSQKIKSQIKAIKYLDSSMIDTAVLREYKDNFKKLQDQSDCKYLIDSMITKSDYLKDKQ